MGPGTLPGKKCVQEVGTGEPVKLSAVEIEQIQHRRLAVAVGSATLTGKGGRG